MSESAYPRLMEEGDTVWIPAVPVPFRGWRTDRCGECGRKFRGRNRRTDYELHYRREHERPERVGEWGKPGGGRAYMAVSRAEAERIYSRVRGLSGGKV